MFCAATVTACGGGRPEEAVVEMLDNRFQPQELAVPAGTEVTFVGAGRNPHNAVATDGSWSTESDFGGLDQRDGDAAIVTFQSEGTYPFFCTFHGNAEGDGMAGILTVVPVQDDS